MLRCCIGLLLGLLVAVATGCSTDELLPDKKIDYKSAKKLPPLEIPPDLTQSEGDDYFSVPDINPQGSATYSAYSAERTQQPKNVSGLLPTLDVARVESAGTQRWLVLKAEPDDVWPVVKEFWQELGLIVNIERPEAGIMETDWAENRANLPKDIVRNFLGRVLDQAYESGTRDKFRT
ncbi:MAG: outer membrane protein assembly factor BamC, partial [Burkholderiales bacterium]